MRLNHGGGAQGFANCRRVTVSPPLQHAIILNSFFLHNQLTGYHEKEEKKVFYQKVLRYKERKRIKMPASVNDLPGMFL